MRLILGLVIVFLFRVGNAQITTRNIKNTSSKSPLISNYGFKYLPFSKKIYKNTIKEFSFKSPFQYWDELGIVCKWELKMDNILTKPVRFRLGSLDYVNRMEGKIR
ncbi:MAG: hypothetical protein ABI844_04315 [Saprospiraceae bacterium]